MTFLEAMNKALLDSLNNPQVLLLGQLVKYGLGGLTAGAYERHPKQVLTYPVCENLMNASAMGLALAGFRPVVVHERMDFLAIGMDPLVNHMAIWPARAEMRLPVVVLAVVGKGKGQGPQHSKNLAPWFRMLDGWTVAEPQSPREAYNLLIRSILGKRPVLYVAHREFFNCDSEVLIRKQIRVGFSGASARHEAEFYTSGILPNK